MTCRKLKKLIILSFFECSGIWWLMCFVFFWISTDCSAQEAHKEQVKSNYSNKWIRGIMGVITREPGEGQSPFTVKSVDPYLNYEGKIIRKISIKQLGFDQTVLDTARTLHGYILQTANTIHIDTKDFVIRNNLFIREGAPLNPYRLADNERTLRDLEFIKDARIFVVPIVEYPDSVDLLVITRDLFNLGGAFVPKLPAKYSINIEDINLAGMGHQVQAGYSQEVSRTPRYGYEVFYKVTNIKGTFLDASVGYTQLNSGISIGHENERSLYFKLSRDLYQPFARLAGALEFSNNISRNVYKEPERTFSQYHYQLQDYWIGYSFGFKELPKNLKENRNRTFVALRRLDQHFVNGTNITLSEFDRFAYRDLSATLAQLTFFRRDFYKTQYVLGFGRTEDIPYGYRISVTTGWEEELENRRPYLGGEFHYSKVRTEGNIFTYDIKLGAYWNESWYEDGLFSINVTRYSKAYEVGNNIIRNSSEIGYALLLRQQVKKGINISDFNGISGFEPDSLTGVQRLKTSQEITIFTPFKILGFHIAPIARIDLALIQADLKLLDGKKFYSGFSTGFRARNENLIFKILEARIFYYPKVVEGIDHIRYTVTMNFKKRYPTNLVNKPATVFQ